MEPHLTDRETERAVHDPLDEGRAAHLAGCPRCRRRVHVIAREETLLHRLLFRVEGHRLPGLVAYVGAERDAPLVARHHDGCPHCADEVGRRRARERRPLPAPLAGPSGCDRVATIVLLAPPSNVVPVPVRGEKEPLGVYELPEARLVVSTQPSMIDPGASALYGSLLLQATPDPDLPAVIARLYHDDMLLEEVTVASYGSFVFDPIPSGRFTLSLTMGERYVIIDDLTVP